ncbi:MAG TPA: MFS transporter [Polyangiales bacterium]|nr:MFS transporter [Polyangiales bacterium]
MASIPAQTPITSSASAPRTSITGEEKTVIFASSLGTVFEWYDFYLYGSLASVISAKFFSAVNPTAAFIFALLAFAAGFAVRPFGALVFGRLGDLVGRKYTFLVTILLMGGSTFVVGILPSYETIGITAPIILIVMRLIQGLALGGEYGGAATYVGEHAPQGKRGLYTSWIQTTATLGLFLSLLVILGTRLAMDPAAFDSWGWRIPFLFSVLLVAVSVWIRLKLNESPLFLKMKKEGKGSKNPLTESFAKWPNLRLVLIALFGLAAGQAVVWYTGQFYALFFLTQTLKVESQSANLMMAAALALATPFFIVFGALSDRYGRKWIILGGCLLAALTYFPLFKGITHYANPALEAAVDNSPVTVVADDAQCSVQFNPVGTSKFTSPCDIAKAALVKRGIPYSNEQRAGAGALIRVGNQELASYDGKGTDAAAQGKAFDAALTSTLAEAKYPAKADPAQVNTPMVIALLFILVLYVTIVYGPIAAILLEMFPTRIRYTSMSLPYHIGNGWFGGFLPTTAFAIVASTGDVYSGLWYPIVIAIATAIIGAVFVRETKDVDIMAV